MTIRKNTHAPFRLPHFYLHHKSFYYELQLTDSCKYRFGTYDDNDINKLFGVAFITWGSVWFTLKSIWKVIVKRKLSEFKSLHHYNSIRYGWRYDALSNRFEVWRYVYLNGDRFMWYVDGLNVGESVKLEIIPIDLNDTKCTYALGGKYQIWMPAHSLKYKLLPYFGGNRKAPHDMIINLKRL
jgi:hypothetical protein